METNIVFISGGVRSGKSSFAEQFVAHLKCAGQRHYIASAKRVDREMEERIKRHQRARSYSQHPWITWECPVDLHLLVHKFNVQDVALLDCLTILLANELYRKDRSFVQTDEQVIRSILHAIDVIARKIDTLVIVSNEVLFDGISHDPSVQDYQRAIGRLHQAIVKRAQKAVLIESGMPIWMKG